MVIWYNKNMNAKSKKQLMTFLSAVSKDNSPRLFMPFVLTAIPCIIIDVITFGIGLIFTSFIWLMLDIECYRYLRTGETRFICFYHNGLPFKTIYLATLLRRIILLFAYVCLIFPGIYLSARLCGLSTTILANPTERNPLTLLQLTYQSSKSNQKNLLTLWFNTFYIVVLTILSFGVISPWSIPYYRMLRHAHYMYNKKLEYAPNLIECGNEELAPPEYAELIADASQCQN